MTLSEKLADSEDATITSGKLDELYDQIDSLKECLMDEYVEHSVKMLEWTDETLQTDRTFELDNFVLFTATEDAESPLQLVDWASEQGKKLANELEQLFLET